MRCGRRSIVLVLTLLAACGGGGSSAPPTTSGATTAAPPTTAAATTVAPTTLPTTTRPATTASAETTAAAGTAHDGTIDQGESAVLVDQLVEVPGFRYVEVAADERAGELALLPATVLAASFHSVQEARTGTEAGFLALYLPDPSDAMHAPDNELAVATSTLGAAAPELVTYGAQHVYRTTDATGGAAYTWLRHGTQGWLDGPDAAVLEQWLAGYFAEPYLGPEPATLAARAVPLDGWAYTDAVDRSDELEAVVEAVPGANASLHYVFDRTHMFGGLALVERADGLSGDDLGGAVIGYLTSMGVDPTTLARGDDLDAAGTPVMTMTAGAGSQTLTVYVWTWPDGTTGGWLLTNRPDLGNPFVTALVSAAPVS